MSRDIAPMRGLALRKKNPFDAKFDDEFMKERCCPLKVRSAKSGHVQCTIGNVRSGPKADIRRRLSCPLCAISYTVGNYYGTGLLTKALKIQVENDGRLTVPGEC